MLEDENDVHKGTESLVTGPNGKDITNDRTKLLTNTKKPYPRSVFFILGNEFCERYSYYGMRTILVLYLKYYMLMSDTTSTAIYHAFTVLCYLFPIMGAILADSWLGKYKTILYLSIVYAIGMILNTTGACPPLGNSTTHIALSSLGLFVIAIGTGGIKPCVSSFGGDQFAPDQEQYRRSFFSLFYFAINAGSLISTIVSPIMREDVHCFGRKDCYALAFGIPGILMIIAIFIFVAGTRLYKIKSPEGNVLAEVFRGIWSAIKRRWRTPRSARTKEHWMDYALIDTNARMVRDIKYVLRILILYIPLPLFWTLFDQQGSRWTLQATRMNGYVGSIRIKPDQIQVLNPLLIVTLIPLVETTLYPCLQRFNLNFSPLRRMTAGMILAGFSFIVAGVLQGQMDKTLTVIPEQSNQASFRIINAANCKVQAFTDIYPEWAISEGNGVWLSPGEATGTLEKFAASSKVGKTFSVRYRCGNLSTSKTASVHLGGKTTWTMVISGNDSVLKDTTFKGIVKKSEDGGAIIRVFNSLGYEITIDGLGKKLRTVASNHISKKWDLDKNNFTVKVYDSRTGKNISEHTYYFATGGVYTLLVWNTGPNNANQTGVNIERFVDVSPSVVSLFWMIPQYFLITLGEVFLSVTGLEFSYSQAPTSMKSVLASLWLLTVSLGNMVTLIIAESRLVSSQAAEFFLFAGLIGVATIVFILLAIRYQYVDETEFYEDEVTENRRTSSN